MIVGAALVEIHVHGSQSLKQKRGVVRSIQQRLRNRFNLSVAEVGGQGTWQRAVFGLTTAGADAVPVRRVLERAIDFIEELHLAEIVNSDLELLVLPHEASFEEWDASGEGDEEDDDGGARLEVRPPEPSTDDSTDPSTDPSIDEPTDELNERED
jgi:uncharacterized protein YlxP (DUF503 family)